MRRVRTYLVVSFSLVVVLLLSAAPGAFAGPTGPTADTNDPFVRAARFYKNHRAPNVVQAPAGTTAIATGLNNPRGIAIGPDGGIYVAEAGYGDPASCGELFPGSEACVGASGSVTRIENGVQERIATGMPSWSDASGFGAIGPADIAWRPRDAFFVTLGLGFGIDPADLANINPVGGMAGTLARMNPNGYWSLQADLWAYEVANNPEPTAVDSNPYGVIAVSGRHRIVADAGGNDLLKINNTGGISTITTFPDTMVPAPPFLGLPPGAQIPMQAVPTSVVRGPNNTYYVGQLTGFPFPSGGAKIFQVWPNGEQAVFAEGFTAIVDVATGPDGSLYVVQIADDLLSCETMGVCNGQVYRVDSLGNKTLLATNLLAPGGVAVSQDGQVYVTIGTIFPGDGMVIRLD